MGLCRKSRRFSRAPSGQTRRPASLVVSAAANPGDRAPPAGGLNARLHCGCAVHRPSAHCPFCAVPREPAMLAATRITRARAMRDPIDAFAGLGTLVRGHPAVPDGRFDGEEVSKSCQAERSCQPSCPQPHGMRGHIGALGARCDQSTHTQGSGASERPARMPWPHAIERDAPRAQGIVKWTVRRWSGSEPSRKLICPS